MMCTVHGLAFGIHGTCFFLFFLFLNRFRSGTSTQTLFLHSESLESVRGASGNRAGTFSSDDIPIFFLSSLLCLGVLRGLDMDREEGICGKVEGGGEVLVV